MAKEQGELVWDYIAFVVFVLIIILVPLLIGRKNKKQNNTKKAYIFAAGVSSFSIMLSLCRGVLGIRSVLGYPAEMFYRGSGLWELLYGYILAFPLVSFIFVPVYFHLNITSIYQYIDLRFNNRTVRCLASATYLLRQFLSLGIILYTPSVALSAILGVEFWIPMIAISCVCVIFSIWGGLKASINADVISSVFTLASTIFIIVLGIIQAGGYENVHNINRDNDRFQFLKFTGDMTVRVDTTSALIGQLFSAMSQYGCQQNFMQRFSSIKSIKRVHVVMFGIIPLVIVFFSLAWISGMTIYATYYQCDPLKINLISRADEILPFYVQDRIYFIPGFLGFFMATIFSGGLVMNVSNLNSLSTVVFEDFLSLIPSVKNFTDRQQLITIKSLAIVFGLLTMGIAYGVGQLKGIVDTSNLAFQATSGPLLGVFVLAMLCPVCNWKGATAGMVVGHVSIIWLAIGKLIMGNPTTVNLPTSTEGCANFTFAPGTIPHGRGQFRLHALSPSHDRTILETLYSISYMYYCVFGTLITVIVGIIVSYCTRRSSDEQYSSKYLHPWVVKISQKIPGKKSYFIEPSDVAIEHLKVEGRSLVSLASKSNIIHNTSLGGKKAQHLSDTLSDQV